MAYNNNSSTQQRSVSPGTMIPPLRAPIRMSSNPPSPLTISATHPTGFAFPAPVSSVTPSSLSASTPASSSYSNGAYASLKSAPAAPYQGTARFHQAFNASGSGSRHASSSSVSSDKSFRFPLSTFNEDANSPIGERTFDSLQRELAGNANNSDWLDPNGMVTPDSRGPSPRFNTGGFGGWGNGARSGRVFDEPIDAYDGMSGDATVRRGSERGISSAMMDEVEAMPSSGFGRPASMAYESPLTNGSGIDGESGFDFLLSPPPSAFNSAQPSTPRSSSFANLSNAPEEMTPKAKERSRDRSFPAPLLLKSERNRPFPPGPPSPVYPPPAIPSSAPNRRPSATTFANSTSSGPNTSNNVVPVTSSPAPMTSSIPYINSRPGAIPENGSSSRSALPYQRHRPQVSSTSSFTHGSSNLSMTHSPHGSGGSSGTTPTASLSSSIISNNSHILASASAPVLPSSSSQNVGSSVSDPPIEQQALLQHVISLRAGSSSPMSHSQSQGPLTRSTTAPLGSSLAASTSSITSATSSSTHQRNRSVGSANSDAAGSTSNRKVDSPLRPSTGARSASTASKLETVDLSHKRVAELSPAVIDELKGEVEKLALGYNLMKDLPSHFGQLGNCLRYLNVRVNIFTTFPQVLCEMPSLEILDISRNKIKRLPANPGTLVNLKVFSIAKNRVKRLPPWFSSLTLLKVLKVDHNPLEWPPREVAAFPSTGSGGGSSSRIEDAEEMQRWLPALLKWIRENASTEVARIAERGTGEERRRRPSIMTSEDEDRSFDSSLASSTASILPRTPAMTRSESGRLVIGNNGPSGSSSSSTVVAGSRSRATPPSTSSGIATVSEKEETPTSTLDDVANSQAIAGLDDANIRHGRNASHSTTQTLQPTARPELRSKKSLPDLRQSHAEILADRRTDASGLDEEAASNAAVVAAAGAGAASRRQKEDRSGAKARAKPANIMPPTIARSQSARPSAINSNEYGTSLIVSNDLTPMASPLAFDSPTPRLRVMRAGAGATDLDRNSGAYFRRLSMLPASTISKAVPVGLLEFANSIRGILFALSQIYSALRQFVVFATQDRLPGSIAKLMGTADATMSELINALDRFDSLSRRATPSAEIVQDIFVACRDNVVIFFELVQALGPHLGALVATADVRYTRTLLLMLYGSTGEIANSWTSVAPMLAEMASIGEDPTLSALVVEHEPSSNESTASSGGSSRLAVPGKPGLFRTRSKSRRHAGSFSVEDVQMGAELPPAPIPEMPSLPNVASYSSSINGTLSTSSSGTDLHTSSATTPGGDTIRAYQSRSANRPFMMASGITLPPTQGYREMVNEAFDQPMTPGITRDLMHLNGGNSAQQSMDASLNLAPVSSSALSIKSNGSGSSNGSAALTAALNSVALPLPPGSRPAGVGAHTRNADSFSLPRSQGGRPVSTANADATFVDMAESTVTIARSIYGMLIDSFDAADPASAPVDDEGARLARALGPRRAQELGDLTRLGNETTTNLRAALARVRAPDSRGPLRFTPSDAKKLGDEAYAFVQTVIKFAKLVKAISVEHGFAPRIREGVGQLTIATREFAKTLSNSSFNRRDTRAQRTAAIRG